MSRLLRRIARPLVTLIGFILLWKLLIALEVGRITPRYTLLPSPEDVLSTLWRDRLFFAEHASATFAVALIGYRIGSWFGAANALSLARSATARRWLLPLLIGGQSVPVFALGPLLVMWLGVGPEPKIVMTALVVYFPVTAAYFDGLSRVDPKLLEMARVMGADASAELWRVRVPAAAPALGSGLRLAAVFAPISAVIGEMTGAAGGLGYVMRQAHGQAQEPRLFAALFLLALFGVLFHAAVRHSTRRAVPWAPDAPIGS